MRFLYSLVCILVMSTVADRACAADMIGSSKDGPAHILPSTAVATESWTGIWAAALAGYSMSNTDLSLNIFDNHGEDEGERVGGGKLSGLGGEGFDATLQLGGDYQINDRVLVGGWAEYAFGGTESSARVDAYRSSARLDVDQNDSYGLFARAGMIFGDTLVYGAGGYVWTEADAKLSGTGLDTVKRSFDFSGPAAELGVEHRFTSNIRGKLSARYTWFGEETVAKWGEDDCYRGQLDAEPGVFSVKAGVVISTTGLLR